MKELGTVKKISGRLVTVSIQLQEGCASCAMNGACHTRNNAVLVYNRNEVAVNEGDDVEVEVQNSEQAKGAFWVLVLPLVALFAGYGAGKALFPGPGEGTAVACSGALFALTLLIGTLIQKRKKFDSFPFITKRFETGIVTKTLAV
jgi:positive regulator of sigma E activity